MQTDDPYTQALIKATTRAEQAEAALAECWQMLVDRGVSMGQRIRKVKEERDEARKALCQAHSCVPGDCRQGLHEHTRIEITKAKGGV